MKPWPLVIAWAILCLGAVALLGYFEYRKEESMDAQYDTRRSQ